MTHRQHRIEDVIGIFNQTFRDTYATELVSGRDEPLYQPASSSRRYHQIIFAHGFYRSALHEIAHWCVAGKVRRHIVDYGYWYQPDGRNAEVQRQFERVECKPQALEWLFCLSAGHGFEVSCDNLAAADPTTVDSEAFTRLVAAQLQAFARRGVPERARLFAEALQRFYRQPDPLIELAKVTSQGIATSSVMTVPAQGEVA